MEPGKDPGYIRYLPLTDRPTIEWPGGARLALGFAPNLEFYEFLPTPDPFRSAWGRTGSPDVMSYAYRDYGNRVGFWRMLEVFDEFEAPASVRKVARGLSYEIGGSTAD
jgi:allantoinase